MREARDNPASLSLALLHDDLKPYVQDGPLGKMLQHPLVQEICGIIPALVNERLEAKRLRVDELEQAGEWAQAIWFYERPWRLAYLALWWDTGRIDLAALRELLPSIWIDAEAPRHVMRTALALFRATGFVTDIEDGGAWALPKEPVTLYRGVGSQRAARGMSWTKAGGVAAFFARRYARAGRPGYIYETTVKPTAILGIFEGRGESEVVVNPRKLKDVHLIETITKGDTNE